MRFAKTNAYSRGLTLVELMIGLALSLLILGAAVSVFMGSKETFRLEEQVSLMQENFRFIADRFNKDFSMVGYTGCAMPYTDNSPTIDAFVSGPLNTAILQGAEGGAGPDSITISFARPETGIPVVAGGATRESPLYVSRDLPLYQALKDNSASATPVPITLLVGNCDRANIFLVTGASDTLTPDAAKTPVGAIAHAKLAAGNEIGGINNTSSELSDNYGRTGEQTSMVFQRADVTYEIDTVSGVTGLYETRNGGAKQLVLENVTDMQILYGIDSPSAEDGNADSYQDWADTLRVSDITCLKITLTMVVSQANGVNATRDYSFTIKLRDMGLDV